VQTRKAIVTLMVAAESTDFGGGGVQIKATSQQPFSACVPNCTINIEQFSQGVYIIRWDFNEGFLFHVAHRINLPLDGARIR
jgi:hypothetical protein